MLDRAGIEARIPHAGRMCLLDAVLAFDAGHILCRVSGHRSPEHPLREAGGLPVWAAIEFAAQAAAVHGALLRGDAGPRAGALGRVRDVRPGCAWLDAVATDLEIGARLLHRDAAGGIYAFEARGDGALLASGRFTLVFTDGAAGASP